MTNDRSRDPAPGVPGAPGDQGHEPPPPGAHLMNVVRWTLFAGLLVVAGVSITSYVLSRRSPSSVASGRQQALYHCPMHPSYTSNKPGECPICGMSLEPIPAAGEVDHAAMGHGGDVPGLSPIHLTPERAQLIGVRTARVEQRRMGGQLELVGFVTPDESWLSRVQVRAAGWVEFLHVSRTGDRVELGEPLLSLYSPELYQSEQEFLIEIGAHADSALHAEHRTSDLDSARERLALLGIPQDEIARLERDRVASARIVIRSPARGTVLERGVTQGQYVAVDTPLFTIADLSRIWVLADLYEMDMGRVRPGDEATFTTDGLPGRVFAGRVEFVYPTVSSETRTVKIRLALANPGEVLKPGMFGKVRVRGAGPPRLAVPSEAVVRAGEHDYVFLSRAGGTIEPRMVSVGMQDDEWVEILKGVARGDTVVASASFLIDSESRLKAAIAGMGAQPSAGHQH